MAQGKEANTYKIKSSDAKNKVKIAQEALEKQKERVNNLKIDYKTAVALYNYSLVRQQKPSRANVTATGNALVRGRNTKGKISQAVTDRSRTASRASGILNRENKKIK